MYIVLPQPSQVLEKSGLTVTVEMLPSLINMVIPVGISRTVLNHGVQVAINVEILVKYYFLIMHVMSVTQHFCAICFSKKETLTD